MPGEVHPPDLPMGIVLKTVLLSPTWGSRLLNGNVLRLRALSLPLDVDAILSHIVASSASTRTSLCKAGSRVCSLPRPIWPLLQPAYGVGTSDLQDGSHKGVALTVYTDWLAVTSVCLSLRILLSTPAGGDICPVFVAFSASLTHT